MRTAVLVIAYRDTSVRKKQECPFLADTRRDRPNRVIVRRVDLRQVRKNAGLGRPVRSEKLEVVPLSVVPIRVYQGHERILEVFGQQ